MNTVIDNCKMFLETHRNATGSWKDILSSVRDYIHNKLIQEYMKIDAHPFPNEIAGTGDKFMINKGHNVRNQSLEELRIQNNRKQYQERMTQLHNENNKMIIKMKNLIITILFLIISCSKFFWKSEAYPY